MNHAPILGTDALFVKAFMPRNSGDHLRVTADFPSAALKVLRVNLDTLLDDPKSAWSEPTLAKRAGFDQKTLWRVRHGEHEPKLDTISKLAKALDLQPWQLFTPGLVVSNPPMLEKESAKIKALLENFKNTKEALDGALRDQGNTRPQDL